VGGRTDLLESPRIPTGRGNGLKTRPVWVRIPPRAPYEQAKRIKNRISVPQSYRSSFRLGPRRRCRLVKRLPHVGQVARKQVGVEVQRHRCGLVAQEPLDGQDVCARGYRKGRARTRLWSRSIRPSSAAWHPPSVSPIGVLVTGSASDPPETFPDDNACSLQYGVAGEPEYSSLPAQPTPREDDGYQLEEMDWAARGFILSDRPYYNVDPFPQVD
jgi:hypothetical protein